MVKEQPKEDMPLESFDQNQSYIDNEMGFEPQLPTEDPIRHQTELDNKIISSDYKSMKILLRVPRFEEKIVNTVYKDKFGKPRLFKGKPVLKGTQKASVFMGYEEEEVDFPIKNLYNDSVTGAVLDKQEANAVRVIDDLIWTLGMQMTVNPNVDYTSFLHRLNGTKASIVDTSRAIGGRALELSKTTISKGESSTYDYRSEKQFDEFQARKNKRTGLLGLGLGPL